MDTSSTGPRLLNSIAFEFFRPGTNNEVCSYICIPARLIKSADDASILASCGTIKREIGSGQAVADLIERVSTDAFWELAIFLYEYYRKKQAKVGVEAAS